MMNSNPCVLVVSSSNTKPKSLIKLITKTNHGFESGESIYPWKLKTKYYIADINFVAVEDDLEIIDSLSNNIEAFIIHMDSNKITGLEDLSKWEFIEDTYQPDVKLLVSNYCNLDTKITKVNATEWCIKHGFEFVELYPSEEIMEEEEFIPEKKGVERIKEALEAHIWSNLVMNDANPENPEDGADLSHCDIPDDFTELFSQFHIMKDSIQSLPMSERKLCAEQIVTAFWKAIGGDEDEISDL